MRIKKGLGIIVILLTALIMGFIGFNKINKAKKEFAAAEAALPESAISAYFGHIKDKDFDGIYEDSMVVSPHINSKADYIAKLEEIYKGVNTSDIEYTGLDNTDGSKDYKLYYNKQYLATLKLIKASDGKWMASSRYSEPTSTPLAVIFSPTGTSIT